MSGAIEKVLLTWYPKDHPLHLNPLPAALGLAGEAGELVELFKKNEYKPSFSWWKCKHCEQLENSHQIDNFGDYLCNTEQSLLVEETYYTPLILDELGDLWYYLRILAYIVKHKNPFKETFVWRYEDVLVALSAINYSSAKLLDNLLRTNEIDTNQLYEVCRGLVSVCELLDVTINELTESNHIKLNSDPTHHGWKGA